MIAGLLEMLTRRKDEAARQTATIWQQLVIGVADNTTTDADAVLTALDRLNKSPDDLAKAVELLAQRRTWSATVAAGATAETEHPKITAKIAAENAAFAELEAAHDRKLWPLSDAKNAAANAISAGAGARIELARTCTDPLALQAVADCERRMHELRIETAAHSRELRAKEDRLAALKAQEDSDLGGHVARLTREIEIMQVRDLSFATRAAELNAESEAARQRLLLPEAV